VPVDHDLIPIGTLVELLHPDYPDISHSSLRFLEREGLLTPARTTGGHRMYGSADLQRVRQIKDWQAQHLSLEDIRQRLTNLASVRSASDLASAFLERALNGDQVAARNIVLDAEDAGLPLETSFGEVLQPALVQLGDSWANGTATVAQEKEVSEVARDVIAELSLRHTIRDRQRRGRVVAACIAGERHELGLRMICGLLRARGIGVHYLGVDVAPDFLADAVRRRDPQAVLLSITSDDHLPALAEIPATLPVTDEALRLFAGGQAVARHPDIVESYGIEQVLDGVEVVIDALSVERDR
jgi:DNA-binding transcriptional MerR regulator